MKGMTTTYLMLLISVSCSMQYGDKATTPGTFPTEEWTTLAPTTLAPSTTTDLPTTTTEPPTTTQPPTTTPVPTTSTEGTTTSAPPLCPAVDDPLNPVRIAHETSCTLYYLCVAGVPTTYTCPPDYHFNPVKSSCLPVNQAGCDRCPDVWIPGEDVRFPHEAICRYYYFCDEIFEITAQCSFGLHFSRYTRECVTPEEAKCTLEHGKNRGV